MSLPPLVLLPGMMLDETVFSFQTTMLARATSISVHVPTRFTSIAEMASDVLRAAPPQFAVAGLSLGGVIAFELWRQAPERITQMALIDTTPHDDPPQRREHRVQQIKRARCGGLRDVLEESMLPLYLARKNRANQELSSLILAMGMQLGPEVFERQSLALRDRKPATDILESISCPALVLCGREDALCPAAWHVRMAELMPHADLTILADCGHLSPLESPEAVAIALDHLLRRQA